MEKVTFHLVIATLSLVACLIILIPFWINRKHYLINYYGFKQNFGIGVLVTCAMFLNSLCYAFEAPCIFSTTIQTIGACIPMAFQCGRYISTILYNKANILKAQILTINNKSNPGSHENSTDFGENYDFFDPNNLKNSEKSNSNREMNIEKSIEKKYIRPIYIVYGILILSSYIACIILNKDNVMNECDFSSITLFAPILATMTVLVIFVPYILIYTFRNMTIERKIDIISFICVSLLSGFLFTLSKMRILKFQSESYYFYFSYYSSLLFLTIPLYNIYVVNKKVNKKSSKEDFVKLLFNKKFVSVLKEQAINLYCVENVLFWEMHLILMTVVFDNFSASKLEKRRNKMTQKKSTYLKNDGLGRTNRLMSASAIMNKFEGSTENTDDPIARRLSHEVSLSCNRMDNEEVNTINVVVDSMNSIKSNTPASPNTVSTLLSPIKDGKQDIYEMAVINFVNEKNIVFYTEEQEMSPEANTKIENLYKLIFNEYCQTNNIKLTKKELMINYFVVDENLAQYFKKVYDIFLKPDGISTLNVSDSIVDEVQKELSQPNFSHKAYKQVLSEVVDMMYFNLYLNILKKINI